jgi:glycosyltransferase involved in cell wall biosynthesis
MNSCSVAVIIITFNEEVNLPYALQSALGWAQQVFVVDSLSTDRTARIAEDLGAAIYSHPFESFWDQKNWALDHLPIEAEWILFLDADEYLSEEIKQEISQVLESVPQDVSGFVTKMKFMYLGRWLRHGNLYKNLVRLVRKDKGTFIQTSGCREKLVIKGRLEKLRSYIVHDDHKMLRDWVFKQMDRILIDATETLNENDVRKEVVSSQDSSPLVVEGGRSRWLKQMLGYLPGPLRPFSQFFYRYILRLGFLDGWQGFIYHFLLQFWYPFMVEAVALELRYRQKHAQGQRDI